MKAIILTYATVQDFERDILMNTSIFKLALNHHVAYLKPNARIITDYVLSGIMKACPEKIISIREKLRYYSSRVEYPDIEFKSSTIVAAVEYLILKQYNEILIIGDNRVHSLEFRNDVNKELDKLVSIVKIYQYSNGNFNLPVKTIHDFVL